jgi:hypothetical protein
MTNLVLRVFDRRARGIPEHQASALGQELRHFKANITVNDDSFVIIYSLMRVATLRVGSRLTRLSATA